MLLLMIVIYDNDNDDFDLSDRQFECDGYFDDDILCTFALFLGVTTGHAHFNGLH